jgi:hypothetical protein
MTTSGESSVEQLSKAAADTQLRSALLQRGLNLEYLTLGWNVVGVFVIAIAAIEARSVALAGLELIRSSKSLLQSWWSGT